MNRLILAMLLSLGSIANAHQPVMDMAPRWVGGYGFQTRVEHFDSKTTTSLEGIYTFDRSVRATFKLPTQDGRVGDLTIGLPLKKYYNRGPRTSNWSVTPSVRLPTGSDPDSAWDFGLSVSYSAESTRFYQLYDLYAWDDRVGIDINAGFAFPGKGKGWFALWDISALNSGAGDRIQTGPVVVYFRGNMMMRAEYKALVYESGSDSNGGYFSLGIGFVY